MKWTVPVPTAIRTLRAAAWQDHCPPKGDYTRLTHALPAGEVANPNRTRGGTAGSTFVKNFGAGRLSWTGDIPRCAAIIDETLNSEQDMR